MKIYNKIIFRVLTILMIFSIVFATMNLFTSADTSRGKVNNSVTSNPNASQQCKNIMNYLKECEIANRCVLGAFNFTDSTNPTLVQGADRNFERIEETYGVTPGLACFFYKPMDDKENVKMINDRIEEYHKRGIIVMVQPGYSQLYSKYKELANSSDPAIRKKYEDVNFDCFTAQLDATNPDRNMDIYNDCVQDRIWLADALEDLQKRGISVICRLTVEPNNPNHTSFYSPTSKAREHFRNYFRQLYDYLVKERKLNNFLSAWCPSAHISHADEYWPGEEYVDFVSPTCYPAGQYGNACSIRNMTEMFYEDFTKYGKVMGYSEYGVSATATEPGDWGIAGNALEQRFKKITWVSTWCNENGFFNAANINSEKFLEDDRFVTLDELPDLSEDVVYPDAGNIALFSKKGYKGNYSGLSLGKYSENSLKKLKINLSKINSIRVTNGYKITLYKNSNCTGESRQLIVDSYDTAQFKLSEYKSASVEKVVLNNVALNKPSISSDTSSDTSFINDGTLEFWETYNGKDSWVIIDLEDVYSISSYNLSNISSYEGLENANIVDFRIRYSVDGKVWKDADVVFGNSKGSITRNIQQIDAQYVCLSIETPNATKLLSDINRAAVCELSIYGTKIADGQKTDWEIIPTVIKKPNGQIVTTITNTVSNDATDLDNIESDNTIGNNGEDVNSGDKVNNGVNKPKDTVSKDSYLWLWIVGGIIIIGGAIGTVFVLRAKKKTSL